MQRARQFYADQATAELTPAIVQFIGRMEMAFIATSNRSGDCDCSFRAGPAGFITVVDERRAGASGWSADRWRAALPVQCNPARCRLAV
jgi:predicted pyridoxine 5'-phosphate oxidase superfamily flavin-nucleotide-binding protein